MMVDLDKLEREYVGSNENDVENDLGYLDQSEILVRAVASLSNAVNGNACPTLSGQLLD